MNINRIKQMNNNRKRNIFFQNNLYKMNNNLQINHIKNMIHYIINKL